MESNKMKLDDKIFRFVYITAMRDAVIQLAYKGNKKWLMESEIILSLKKEIEPLIDKVINGEYISQEMYDEEFLNTTIRVCEYINGKSNSDRFTFGNAQKLINIMLKYFYIVGYKGDSKKECFRFCHCPMDQLLLQNVWHKRSELNSNISLNTREWFLQSWGNEDFELDSNGEIKYPRRYIVFQQAVRCYATKSNIDSLEYDYCVW